MNAYDIIEKKRFGKTLTAAEITFFVDGFTRNIIPDYQMSALLMAICINGMNEEETFSLTKAMLDSGDVCDVSNVKGIVVDKHSTGGVGDSTTLALAPILACCGVVVAKMSGRGLGFTGGTIDKLESIPGFDTALSEDKFISVANTVGCCVIGQTANLVPADKKLYALRDVTATIDCIPLICGSIISKKLASGASVILLDVKYGTGAFMKTKEDALRLSKLMVEIGSRSGKTFAALITDMQQPLSAKIGNTLEILGAIEVLKGAKNRLQEETFEVATKLLALSGKYDEESAYLAVTQAVNSGKALDKFKQMIASQGGDVSFIDHTEKFSLGKPEEILAQKSGWVTSMQAANLGRAVTLLGGGRLVKSDKIDASVGLEMHVKVGDRVAKDDRLVTMYHNGKGKEEAARLLASSIEITDTPPTFPQKIAYAYVTRDEVKYY